MSKILVVAAHPDDEILGAGGTIRKRVNKGDKAYCLILGEGMTSREGSDAEDVKALQKDTLKAAEIIGYSEVLFSQFPDNRFDSVDLLDIIKDVERHVDRIRPEVIYTHHYGDLNIDHQLTFKAVLTTCRPVGDYSVKEIYAFETLSSTEWSFGPIEDAFKPNVFVNIKETLNDKVKAIECYSSELREYPHPRSVRAIKDRASSLGTVVGKEYAEAFELIRRVIS